MRAQKHTIIKIFYNQSHRTHYIQIGETLMMIKSTLALSIADKEGLEIRSAIDIKAIQEMSLDDNKKAD